MLVMVLTRMVHTWLMHGTPGFTRDPAPARGPRSVPEKFTGSGQGEGARRQRWKGPQTSPSLSTSLAPFLLLRSHWSSLPASAV